MDITLLKAIRGIAVNQTWLYKSGVSLNLIYSLYGPVGLINMFTLQSRRVN